MRVLPPRVSWGKMLLPTALIGQSILLYLLAPPASAALKIVGDSRRAGLWQKIYDHLPTAWKTDQTILVREVPVSALNKPGETGQAGKSDDGDDNVDGEYEEEDDRPPVIRLSDSLNDTDSSLVFAHEYGHFVWSEKLSREQQRRYQELWRRQSRTGHIVTAYAGEDAEEGFAEAFSYYLLRPAKLRSLDPASWQFLLPLTKNG